MVVIATLKDGRVIAKNAITAVGRSDAGFLSVQTTITDLKTVEYVLQVNFMTVPDRGITKQDAVITGNIVGLTVYCVGGGTTVSGDVIGIGF